MLKKIKERLELEGVDLVGAGEVGDLLSEKLKRFPFGVTIGIRLLDGILDEITEGPTYTYFAHYRAVNAQLDRCSLLAAKMIERAGYKAFAIPASQSSPEDGLFGVFSHKAAAVRAGLGYIGKSALFLSDEFGPRVRLATVLTDYPFPAAQPSGGACGECMRCVRRARPGRSPERNIFPAWRGRIFSTQRNAAHI